MLAEPEDLVIVCGEFDSEVELIWWSWEPDEVFEIIEIINHPRYKPNEVNELYITILLNMNSVPASWNTNDVLLHLFLLQILSFL